jgi:hypothetical protein
MPPFPEDDPVLDAVGCVWGLLLTVVLASLVGLLAWWLGH